MSEAEWVTWESQPGFVELPDGRRIEVQYGDELLMVESADSVTFMDHRPRTVN